MTNELYHHGIKGMRWGIRRYQNKDGTLTPAGQKRAEQLAMKYERVTGKQVTNHATNSTPTPKKKSISDMTDDELREKANRLTLEKNYLEAQSNAITAKTKLSSLQPKQISKGQAFLQEAGKITKNVIKDAAEKQGKEWLNKTLGDKLGLNVEKEKSVYEKAKQLAEYEKHLYQIEDYKRKRRNRSTTSSNSGDSGDSGDSGSNSGDSGSSSSGGSGGTS